METLGRNQSCQHLDLGHLASRTVRKLISVVYATLSVVLRYDSPRKLIHTLTLVTDLLKIKIPGTTSQINSLNSLFTFNPYGKPQPSGDEFTMGEKK